MPLSRMMLWTTLLLLMSACTASLPNVGALKSQFPVVQYKGPKTPPAIILEKRRPLGWTDLDSIPKVVVGAIIVSEDFGFYRHQGVDLEEFKQAFKENLEAGRFKRGASTLTQQVVKNVFLTSDKTVARKLKEMVLAGRLEQAVGKKRVLETYFNIAEWGAGVFGIGPAALLYFKKSPAQLTAKEGAFLAMLLPSPKRYSQSFRLKKLTQYADKTIRRILEKMVLAHYITAEERVEFDHQPLSFELTAEPGISAPEGDEENSSDTDEETAMPLP